MSQRSWFFVHRGQASGPLSDIHLRTLLASGSVTPATLVWTDGMTDWGKAEDISELWSSPATVPPPLPTAAQPGSVVEVESSQEALAFTAGPWELLGRSLLFICGLALILPAPWAGVSYYRWLISRVRVPGRPDLALTGSIADIWYAFLGLSLISYVGLIDRVWPEYWWVQLAVFPIHVALWWRVVRWIASNLTSAGTPLPIAFDGSFPDFLRWYVVYYLSILTIVGWAWVGNAWTRWSCRHITGSRRRLVYHATGVEILWRTVVAVLMCVLIIPIPWATSWYMRWYVSQFTLSGRGADPAAEA